MDHVAHSLLFSCALGVISALLGLGYGFVFLKVRRRRREFSSGERDLIEQTVGEEIEGTELPPTYRIFTQAALGEFGAVRRSLLAVPCSEAILAQDYSLCAQILMLAFERELDEALQCAVELVQLPLEGDEARHAARRRAVVSVVRILAGVCEEEDWANLEAATSLEPVMTWACRYAAAIGLAKRECADLMRQLVEEAPAWPEESHFSQLHIDLTGAPSTRMLRMRAA